MYSFTRNTDFSQTIEKGLKNKSIILGEYNKSLQQALGQFKLEEPVKRKLHIGSSGFIQF